jgi:hypothetical protein
MALELAKSALGSDGEVVMKIEGGKLVVAISYDLQKGLGQAIDQIEQMIPGDQTGEAAAAKAVLAAKLAAM